MLWPRATPRRSFGDRRPGTTARPGVVLADRTVPVAREATGRPAIARADPVARAADRAVVPAGPAVPAPARAAPAAVRASPRASRS